MVKATLKYAQALGHEVGDKRLDILRRIEALGSISEAARSAGVSYKGAWQAIDTLSNLAGAALVQRSVGGSGGGGALLTDAGRQLLAAADALAHAKEAVLAQWSQQESTGAAASASLVNSRTLAALSLRTSMRNQFPCTVVRLRRAGGAMHAELALPHGKTLTARITRESAQLLALTPGLEVLALAKATALHVTAHEPVCGERNALRGTVARGTRGLNGGEVALTLPGDVQCVGFCPAGESLRIRQTAFAVIDPSAVVIALYAASSSAVQAA